MEHILMCVSAAVVFLLGSAHLIYTFVGNKLRPRKPELVTAMEQDHPGITRQTTMWRAWVGFNASHSLGAMLFGMIYGYLALLHPQFLFASAFLLGTGAAMLIALLILAVRYWFSIPRNGISLALGCYLLSVVLTMF